MHTQPSHTPGVQMLSIVSQGNGRSAPHVTLTEAFGSHVDAHALGCSGGDGGDAGGEGNGLQQSLHPSVQI